MKIRELIRKDFGVDLPIKGGSGNSIEDPLEIELTEINDYIGAEYAFLKFLGIGRGIEWRVMEQALLHHNDRKIDKIVIETKEFTEDEIITQTENYYFDITECFKKKYDVDK